MTASKSTQATRWRVLSPRSVPSGFSLAETCLALAIIAVLAVLGTPMFVRYYHAAHLRVAAEEVVAFLNHGRQIGIKENVGVCVHIDSTAMHYHIGGCSGPTWKGPGTDANGNMKVPQGVALTASGNPTFNHLGLANANVDYFVRNTKTNATLRVIVARSGRISIAP
jgi:Tfp pilus assembly protein FimT